MPAPLGGDISINAQKPGEGVTGHPNYHQPYNQGHFPQQPPYGNPPQQYPPNNGYMGWHNGQQQPPSYGGPWPPGQASPHGIAMYRQGVPHPGGIGGPDRAFGGYRAPPNAPPSRRPTQVDQSPSRKNSKREGPPRAYWGQQQQQWQQQQHWGPGSSGLPSLWQGGPPQIQQQPGSSPPTLPQHMQGVPKMWPGNRSGMASPTRPSRKSPETMTNGMIGSIGYRGPINGIDLSCKPVGVDVDPSELMYVSNDKLKHTNIDKDKGRGSYRCGRCGAPKKGHICPYQPKLKRRPDEPPPEMRNAAIQVEMDEFMTLRRLNIEIQGFSESYATAPHMGENMVVGEPHPFALQAGIQHPIENGEPIILEGPTCGSQPPQDNSEVLRSSPIAASPIIES